MIISSNFKIKAAIVDQRQFLKRVAFKNRNIKLPGRNIQKQFPRSRQGHFHCQSQSQQPQNQPVNSQEQLKQQLQENGGLSKSEFYITLLNQNAAIKQKLLSCLPENQQNEESLLLVLKDAITVSKIEDILLKDEKIAKDILQFKKDIEKSGDTQSKQSQDTSKDADYVQGSKFKARGGISTKFTQRQGKRNQLQKASDIKNSQTDISQKQQEQSENQKKKMKLLFDAIQNQPQLKAMIMQQLPEDQRTDENLQQMLNDPMAIQQMEELFEANPLVMHGLEEASKQSGSKKVKQANLPTDMNQKLLTSIMGSKKLQKWLVKAQKDMPSAMRDVQNDPELRDLIEKMQKLQQEG